MGWANCGEDSRGRPIGYAIEAVCDELGCEEEIDRGLSYVCGDMHGECEYSCEQYFCSNHRRNWVLEDGGRIVPICNACAGYLILSDQWIESDDGYFVRAEQKSEDS